MNEVVFKDVQMSQLSSRLGIPKTTVTKIWDTYINRLSRQIEEGKTVKFLNVCYLRVNDTEVKKGEGYQETLAYIAHEIADELSLSQVLVYRVLTSFEEYLILDIQNLYCYSIRGICRIRLERYGNSYKVRIKKSTKYNAMDVYISTMSTFKRKVESAV